MSTPLGPGLGRDLPGASRRDPTRLPRGNPDGVQDKTMASWALGLSLVPCAISLVVALVLAIVVLSRREPGVDQGRGRAVAALCVVGGWAALLGVVVVAGVLDGADRDESGDLTAGGRSLVVDLQVGDCVVADPGRGETTTVEVVPCEEPHRGEVFATFDLEGAWTDQRDVSRLSEARCVEQFAAYAGAPLRRTDLELVYFHPVDASSFAYDPGVVCLGIAPQPATTSFRGTGPSRGGGGEAPAPA